MVHPAAFAVGVLRQPPAGRRQSPRSRWWQLDCVIWCLRLLLGLTRTLRLECPWEREQTHQCLRPPLHEGAHEVREAIESVWLILAVMQPLAALVYVWDGIVMGAGAFGYLAWAMVVSGVAAVAVLVVVVPLGWGLPGVWWAIGLLNIVRAATLGWWHLRPASSLRPGVGAV